jgi:hypothetical protein
MFALPAFENLYQVPRDKNKIIFMSFHLLCYEMDASGIHTHIYVRTEGRDAKLLLMPNCFAKLLEAKLSYFAKIKWMPR